MKQIKSPTILQALFPIIFLVVLLTINVSVFGDDALSGSIQIVLILSSAFASIIAFNLGLSGIAYKEMIKTALFEKSNDKYWQQQMEMDLWIYQILDNL